MISSDDPLNWETMGKLVACGHSRLPVFLRNDRETIVGVVLVKDAMHAMLTTALDGSQSSRCCSCGCATGAPAAPSPSARSVGSGLTIRRIPVLNRETPLYEALNLFQTGRSHMALVVSGPSASFVAAETKGHSRFGEHLEAGGGHDGRQGGQGGGHRESATLEGGDAAAAWAAAGAEGGAPAKSGALGILTLEDVLEELLQEEIYDEGAGFSPKPCLPKHARRGLSGDVRPLRAGDVEDWRRMQREKRLAALSHRSLATVSFAAGSGPPPSLLPQLRLRPLLAPGPLPRLPPPGEGGLRLHTPAVSGAAATMPHSSAGAVQMRTVTVPAADDHHDGSDTAPLLGSDRT